MNAPGSLSERMAAVNAGRAARARFDWGSVTLADFAALAVLRSADPGAALDAAWDAAYASGAQVWPSEPARLSARGLELLAGWRAAVAREDLDPAGAVLAARELLGAVGFLTVRDAARLLGYRG